MLVTDNATNNQIMNSVGSTSNANFSHEKRKAWIHLMVTGYITTIFSQV